MPTVAQIGYAGYEFSDDVRSGKTCTVKYLVPRTLVSNVAEAINAPGIPIPWSTLVIDGKTYEGMTVKSRSVQHRSDNSEKDFTVIVTFTQEFHTPIAWNIAVPIIEWRIGTQAKHVDLSVDGRIVGHVTGVTVEPGPPENPYILDPNAELGYDRIFPTLEFSIRMPITHIWNPVVVSTLIGHVNQYQVTLQGGRWVFPPGNLLFLSGDATPIGPLPTDYEVTLYFMVAYAKLVTGIPIYGVDGINLWQGGPILPIKYGTYTRWKFTRDFTDPLNPVIIDRIPQYMTVFIAYPEADFTALRL
jgi:hypothetical protein